MHVSLVRSTKAKEFTHRQVHDYNRGLYLPNFSKLIETGWIWCLFSTVIRKQTCQQWIGGQNSAENKNKITEKKTWHIGIFKESCAYRSCAPLLKERGLFTWRKTIQKPEQLLHVSGGAWRLFEYNVNCAEFGTPKQFVEIIKASYFTSNDITIATFRLDHKIWIECEYISLLNNCKLMYSPPLTPQL